MCETQNVLLTFRHSVLVNLLQAFIHLCFSSTTWPPLPDPSSAPRGKSRKKKIQPFFFFYSWGPTVVSSSAMHLNFLGGIPWSLLCSNVGSFQWEFVPTTRLRWLLTPSRLKRGDFMSTSRVELNLKSSKCKWMSDGQKLMCQQQFKAHESPSPKKIFFIFYLFIY